MNQENKSAVDVLGPWTDPHFESSLIERCKNAWNKPFKDLSNLELCTFLEQDIACDQLLPIAESRLERKVSDDTEFFEEQLNEAVAKAKRRKI